MYPITKHTALSQKSDKVGFITCRGISAQEISPNIAEVDGTNTTVIVDGISCKLSQTVHGSLATDALLSTKINYYCLP